MSALGMGSATGTRIEGIAHLRQSVRDILTTPIGSRVMRRDYGSALFDLIDCNLTPLTLAQIYAATVEALRIWEPCIQVDRVWAEGAPEDLEDGRVVIGLEGTYLPEGRPVTIDGVLV